MFCKYCGNEIQDDAVFCNKCGKRLVLDVGQGKNTQPNVMDNSSVGDTPSETVESVETDEPVYVEQEAQVAEMPHATTAHENAASEVVPSEIESEVKPETLFHDHDIEDMPQDKSISGKPSWFGKPEQVIKSSHNRNTPKEKSPLLRALLIVAVIICFVQGIVTIKSFSNLSSCQANAAGVHYHHLGTAPVWLGGYAELVWDKVHFAESAVKRNCILLAIFSAILIVVIIAYSRSDK